MGKLGPRRGGGRRLQDERFRLAAAGSCMTPGWWAASLPWASMLVVVRVEGQKALCALHVRSGLPSRKVLASAGFQRVGGSRALVGQDKLTSETPVPLISA